MIIVCLYFGSGDMTMGPNRFEMVNAFKMGFGLGRCFNYNAAGHVYART